MGRGSRRAYNSSVGERTRENLKKKEGEETGRKKTVNG